MWLNFKFQVLNLILIVFFTVVILPTPIHAACDPNTPVAQRVANADCPAGLDQIEAIFTNVISVVVGLGFIGTLIMIIMAGFKYLTSGGEPKSIQSAHQTVTWALLGIVFMAVAWLILQLISNFTGINVTIFNVKVLNP